MEEDSGIAFLGKLQTALAQQREHLERTELSRLKENFRIFHLSYQGFYNVLRRKGLVDEDPYKHEQKISEIVPPSNRPFLESERDAQMSVRLSDFDSQLDFLNQYYQFAMDFLDLRRLRDLLALTSYIGWSQLSPTSENMTTRVLAELLEKVVKGGDQMSTSIVTDAHDQLSKLQRQILGQLKKLADYQREACKVEIRSEILPEAAIPESPLTHLDDCVKIIKRLWAKKFPQRPFYAELVQEIIQEDHAPNAAIRKEELLRGLAVNQEKRQRVDPAKDLRRILAEGLRVLATASRTLDECVAKLKDNAVLLDTRRRSVAERFRLWILRAMGHKPRKNVYEVTFNDITTSAVQRETIEFTKFTLEVERKARVYAAILARTGNLARKIEAASEEQLFSFLARNVSEIQLIHRRLQSMDNYFKDAVTGPERPQIRGIKIELTSLKNSIISANRKKHEYVAHKDELVQLKKLGIETVLDNA
ncbi:MAG TPA: hypothetical protein VMW87_03355 [Spirochaetia bacterium]|nr:hypothetical protein [Spirochaetia bacterium]